MRTQTGVLTSLGLIQEVDTILVISVLKELWHWGKIVSLKHLALCLAKRNRALDVTVDADGDDDVEEEDFMRPLGSLCVKDRSGQIFL